MLLTKEERQTIERLYGLTALDRKNITEIFVNLGSLLVLSSMSESNNTVHLPFVGQFAHVDGRLTYTPSPLLTRSVEQARDGDAGEIDKVLARSIGHLFRERI